jgi:hypothetical protein
MSKPVFAASSFATLYHITSKNKLQKTNTCSSLSLYMLVTYYSFKCNKQDKRYTAFFIAVNALHVSGSFSAYHQELKNCTHSIWYMSSLPAATTSAGEYSIDSNKEFCITLHLVGYT